MRQLGLFARHWTPGLVKTRLATVIGPQAAAKFQRACLAMLAQRFADHGDRRVVAFTPPDQRAEFRAEIPATWELAPQSEGDLGQRLAAHLHQSFCQGVRKAVVIGTDSPTLPLATLEAAWRGLCEVDVVLCPADDGGYCLLGARDRVPPVFEGVGWGNSTVLAQTIEHLASAGISYRLLPAHYDVDMWSDLVRLRAELTRPEWVGGEADALRAVIGTLEPAPSETVLPEPAPSEIGPRETA